MGGLLTASLSFGNCETGDLTGSSGGDFYSGGDTGDIAGTALWNPNKDGNYVGVSGADVRLWEGDVIRKNVKTGSGGAFSLRDIPEGHYKLEGQMKSSNLDLFCLGSTVASVIVNETANVTIRMNCN